MDPKAQLFQITEMSSLHDNTPLSLSIKQLTSHILHSGLMRRLQSLIQGMGNSMNTLWSPLVIITINPITHLPVCRPWSSGFHTASQRICWVNGQMRWGLWRILKEAQALSPIRTGGNDIQVAGHGTGRRKHVQQEEDTFHTKGKQHFWQKMEVRFNLPSKGEWKVFRWGNWMIKYYS